MKTPIHTSTTLARWGKPLGLVVLFLGLTYATQATRVSSEILYFNDPLTKTGCEDQDSRCIYENATQTVKVVVEQPSEACEENGNTPYGTATFSTTADPQVYQNMVCVVSGIPGEFVPGQKITGLEVGVPYTFEIYDKEFEDLCPRAVGTISVGLSYKYDPDNCGEEPGGPGGGQPDGWCPPWNRNCGGFPLTFSSDPNQIVGPEGYSDARFVQAADPLLYRIDFENDPIFATAAAQRVLVTYDVDPLIDMFSLRLGSFGFGEYIFPMPEDAGLSYTTRVDVSDSLEVYVDLTAGLDVTKRQIFWIFQSIDPLTGLPPADNRSTLGFLPVNDSTNIGEGFVTFTVAPDPSTVTGDTVRAQADIIFDENENISTNITFNTLDAVAPVSAVSPLDPITTTDSILIDITGTDDPGGAGIAYYELYMSIDGLDFQLVRSYITDTTEVRMPALSGRELGFLSLAVDNTGQREATKTQAEATTLVDTRPEIFLLAPFANQSFCSNEAISFAWTATGIDSLDLSLLIDGVPYPLAQGVEAPAGGYLWEIPDTLTQTYEVQLYVADAQYPQNQATGPYFTLAPASQLEVPDVVTLCAGESQILQAFGADNYRWTPATGLSSDTSANPLVSPDTTTWYTVEGTTACGLAVDSVLVVVNPRPTVILEPYADICDQLEPFALFGGSPAGGTYTGTGVTANVFDPAAAGAGTFPITYTYTDSTGCSATATQSLTVLPGEPIVFDSLPPVCVSAEPLVLSASPAGGTFTGPGVELVMSTFDPAAAGPGLHPITYTVDGGFACARQVTRYVQVYTLPTVAVAPYDPVYAQDAPFTLTGGTPVGGTYAGPGVLGNTFDPQTAGVGLHTIIYSYTDTTGGCTNADTTTLEVRPEGQRYLTQLRAQHCADTAVAFAQPLWADSIAQATTYRFAISAPGEFSDTVASADAAFMLNELTTDRLTYGQPLQIAVQVTVDGYTYDWGPLCTVRTAPFPTMQLLTADCNRTDVLPTDTLLALGVDRATVYRFLVTNTQTGATDTVVSLAAEVSLSALGCNVTFGTTYQIQVASAVGGVWSAAGPVCSVTTAPFPGTDQPLALPGCENRGTEALVGHYPLLFQDTAMAFALGTLEAGPFDGQDDMAGTNQRLESYPTAGLSGLWAPVANRAGEPDRAARFGTDTLRAVIPQTVLDLSADSATLALWFQPYLTGAEQTLLDTKVDDRGFRLTLDSAGYLTLAMASAQPGLACAQERVVVSHQPLAEAQWYHLALIKVGPHVAWYLNGAPAGPTLSVYAPAPSGAGILLGARRQAGTLAGQFTGAWDDLRAYQRSLSLCEVAMLYHTGTLELQIPNLGILAGRLPFSFEETTDLDGNLRQPPAMGRDVWAFDAYFPFDADEYFHDLTLTDAQAVTWQAYDRSGGLYDLPTLNEGYFFGSGDGTDEWGELHLQPTYTYTDSTGSYALGFEIPDRLYAQGETVVHPGAVRLEVLDYGLYFYNGGTGREKWVVNDPNRNNRAWDDYRPTFIYVPGHAQGSVSAHERVLWDGYVHDLAGYWKSKGYNFAVFYWNQFADAGELEEKINHRGATTKAYLRDLMLDTQQDWLAYRGSSALHSQPGEALRREYQSIAYTEDTGLPAEVLTLMPGTGLPRATTWRLERQPLDNGQYAGWNYLQTEQVLARTHGQAMDVADLLLLVMESVMDANGLDVRLGGSGFGAQLAAEAARRSTARGRAPEQLALLDPLYHPTFFATDAPEHSGRYKTGLALDTLRQAGVPVVAFHALPEAERWVVSMLETALQDRARSGQLSGDPTEVRQALWEIMQALYPRPADTVQTDLLQVLSQAGIPQRDLEQLLGQLDLRGLFMPTIDSAVATVLIDVADPWNNQPWNLWQGRSAAAEYYLRSMGKFESTAPHYLAPWPKDQIRLYTEVNPGGSMEYYSDAILYLEDFTVAPNPITWDAATSRYTYGTPYTVDEVYLGGYNAVTQPETTTSGRRAPIAPVTLWPQWDQDAVALGKAKHYQGQKIVQLDGQLTPDIGDDTYVSARGFATSEWTGLDVIRTLEGPGFTDSVLLLEDCEFVYRSGTQLRGGVVVRAVPELCAALDGCQMTWVEGNLVGNLDCSTASRAEDALADAEVPEAGAELAEQPPYPNPFTDQLTVVVKTSQPQPVTIRLYDLMGRPVYTLLDHHTLTAGTHQLQFETQALKSGMYTLIMEGHTTGARMTARVIRE